MSTPDRLAFGDFVLDRSQRRLLRSDGNVVALTPRLYNALLLFVESGLCAIPCFELLKNLDHAQVCSTSEKLMNYAQHR